jgi:hypothetical protein
MLKSWVAVAVQPNVYCRQLLSQGIVRVTQRASRFINVKGILTTMIHDFRLRVFPSDGLPELNEPLHEQIMMVCLLRTP